MILLAAILGAFGFACLLAVIVGLCFAAKRGDEQIEQSARELPPRFPHSRKAA